jgi:hypothetical protein
VDRFLERKLKGKIPRPPDNLAGYLVGMARRMAKEVYGPADPGALAKARKALEARSRGGR